MRESLIIKPPKINDKGTFNLSPRKKIKHSKRPLIETIFDVKKDMNSRPVREPIKQVSNEIIGLDKTYQVEDTNITFIKLPKKIPRISRPEIYTLK